MEGKRRAWIYSRIDAPEDVHGSLKNQRKELFDYAEQMDFEVVGASEDTGNGLDFNRSGLMEVIKVADAGEFDALLVKRYDCLGRNRVKMLEFFQRLDHLGIRIYSPLEGEIRLDDQLSMQ